MPKKRRKFRIGAQEHILTAYPFLCGGPGWANSLVVVLIEDSEGKIRKEFVQPSERSKGVDLLYGVALSAHASFLDEVIALYRTSPGKA